MLTKIYHKKNELFQLEFYQDKECQQAFNFENIKNLYIELKDGDCTPILSLSNKLWSLNIKANIFTPIWYLGLYDGINPKTPLITLNDILDNIILLGKDNAVLFLSEEEVDRHSYDCEAWFLYQKDFPVRLSNSEMDIRDWKTITIFLTNGTEAEFKKASELALELKEKYGIDEVNLFVLHWFGSEYQENDFEIEYLCKDFGVLSNFNKVITTNSTGILEPQDKKRIQILDCYDIFNDYLKKIK